MNDGALGPAARKAAVSRASSEEFDVLVVGGGITGVGIALDASARGLSVLLVESRDIASGTSSKSSKLIHGGLRYLEMRDFGLVREALHERRLLLTTLAPHLVRPVPFLFPLTHRGWERPYLGAGLALYDTMGGAKHLPRARHLSKHAALAAAPALRPDSLVGAVHFYDAQEDDALYAAYVARTAAAHGAAILTRTIVISFSRDESGRVVGAVAHDGQTDRTLHVRARHTILAGGVGSDRLLAMATGKPHHDLRPSKGVHLVVPRGRIDMQSGLFMRTEKSIFHAIPWGDGHWLLGDTDTEWSGDSDAPVASRQDVEYVLSKVNSALVQPLRADDVCGVFAGVRPLVAGDDSADTTRLSRSHRLFTPMPGLTAIAGGKFTTYRVMAKDAVDAAARDLGSVPPSATDRLPLLGAEGTPAGATYDPETGLGREQFARLIWRHGSCAGEVLELIAADASLAAPLTGDPRHVAAEVVHACTHQGALDVDDVLSRRTRTSIEVADRGRAAAQEVARLLGGVLGWSDVRRVEELSRYMRLRDAEAAAEAAPDEATARARYREVLGVL